MLVIASVLSPSALRVTLQQGDRRPLHATAAGKILLAHMDDHERAALGLQVGLNALTKQTITNSRELAKALESVRATGIAWNEGESAPGVGSVAAPVYDASSRVVGAVSSVFPLSQVKDSGRTTLAESVRQTSHDLSVTLGWQGAEKLKRR